jgi:hypothetical protein
MSSVALREFCRGCHEPITIVFEMTDESHAQAATTEESFPCPHGCGFMEHHELQGRIVRVSAGHPPEHQQ